MIYLRMSDPGFTARFDEIVQRSETVPDTILETVTGIIEQVKNRGDQAVLALTNQFDRVGICCPEGLEVTAEERAAAREALPASQVRALQHAVERVERFHRKQQQQTWLSTEEADIMVGQKVTPLERVGIYVPGGKASYPSSVIMNAVPARVAGVQEIVMVCPAPDGELNPAVLVAAELAGVDRVFRLGGAQAVAAVAYGTETIPRVDKITGPGNIYVATAKQLVFGQVGIDMIAGPSEILIINDGSGNPEAIAADLLSQAEHDQLASSVLITTAESFAEKVIAAVERQLALLPRQAIAAASWGDYGAVILVDNLAQAASFSNRLAPEHLELAVNDPFALLPLITNAGAIFMGHYTPEAVGDYLAGPNHTLPTGGTARFFSPLSVDDFVKKSSLIYLSPEGLQRLGNDVVTLAELEGLDAHARSVTVRTGGDVPCS